MTMVLGAMLLVVLLSKVMGAMLLVVMLAMDLVTASVGHFSFTASLSLKSKQVQRPRFNGSEVSTLTILNRSLRLWGPATV